MPEKPITLAAPAEQLSEAGKRMGFTDYEAATSVNVTSQLPEHPMYAFGFFSNIKGTRAT